MKRSLLVLPAIFILFMIGCGDQSTAPERSATTQWEPAEMPEKARGLLETYAYADESKSPLPQVTYLGVIPAELTDNCDVYAVTFLWGDIFGPSPQVPGITDWSGKLALNQDGVVHPRYLIDFEPGQDSILVHDNPAFAAWVSSTQMDFDGISFLVFIKRNTTVSVVPTITFETKPFQLTLTAHQLIHFAAFYKVDENKGVAVHSRLIWNHHCPGGLIDGAWYKSPESPLKGHFQGVWMDHKGKPVGLMTCEYWMNNDGMGEFHGYLSGYITDQIIAEIKGRWYYDNYRMDSFCGYDHGVFFGHYAYDNEDRTGRLKGVFGDYTIPEISAAKLPLVGIWHDDCNIDIGDPTRAGE